VFLARQEAEITSQSEASPRQKCQTLSKKIAKAKTDWSHGSRAKAVAH
jgi:hypothetical protein